MKSKNFDDEMGIVISCGGDSNGRGTPRVSHERTIWVGTAGTCILRIRGLSDTPNIISRLLLAGLRARPAHRLAMRHYHGCMHHRQY